MKKTEINKCEFKNCLNLSNATIRTKKVCNLHYKILKKDNLSRIKCKIQLPKDLNILNITEDYFSYELTYNGKEKNYTRREEKIGLI